LEFEEDLLDDIVELAIEVGTLNFELICVRGQIRLNLYAYGLIGRTVESLDLEEK
jgi:hypothetical protein